MKLNILFADDDPDTLDLYRHMALMRSWNGEFVDSAKKIIEAVDKHCCNGLPCFDAIVADVNYKNHHSTDDPKMTGISAVRTIQETHNNVPTIFVSAYTSIFIREEVQKLGSEIILKPSDPLALFDRIEQIVIWHRQVTRGTYHGRERRVNSLNYSSFNRRSGDTYRVSVPEALNSVFNEVKQEREGGSKL